MTDEERALVSSRRDDPPKALTEREQGVMVVSAAVGLGIGAVVALIATWASWAGFLTAIGTLANVVMAGAAIAAFGLWRRQLQGQAEHEAAFKARRAAHALAMEASISAHTLPKMWVLFDRISDANLRAKRVNEQLESVRHAREMLQSAELDLLASGYGESGIEPLYEYWLFVEEWLTTLEALARFEMPPESAFGVNMAAIIRENEEGAKERAAFVRTLQQYVGKLDERIRFHGR